MSRVILAAGLALVLAACANGGAKREVAAVVQDENARQAAAVTAEKGDGSEEALKKGADAASPETSKIEPPT